MDSEWQMANILHINVICKTRAGWPDWLYCLPAWFLSQYKLVFRSLMKCWIFAHSCSRSIYEHQVIGFSLHIYIVNQKPNTQADSIRICFFFFHFSCVYFVFNIQVIFAFAANHYKWKQHKTNQKTQRISVTPVSDKVSVNVIEWQH